MPTVVRIIVGPIGSGKTLFLGWDANATHQDHPDYPLVSNVPISFDDGGSTYYQEDILKFMAMKMIKGDSTPMGVYVDEGAHAGWESRGSGLKSTDSKLISFARKIGVNLTAASQLISMLDKRLQWNGDFYLLCEPTYLPDRPYLEGLTPEAKEEWRFIPDYFDYKIYNANYDYQQTWRLSGGFAKEYLFDKFPTLHIPFPEMLRQEFLTYYWKGEKRGMVNDEAFKRDEAEFDRFISAFDRN